MNILNGRLEIISAEVVDYNIGLANISATFSDDTGVFITTDITIDDVIFQNLTSFNEGIGKFRILEIYNTTNFSQLDAKIIWDLDEPFTDVYLELESCICRVVNGISALPSFSVQSLSESFVNNVRNLELILKNNPIEVNDALYSGDLDNNNKIFEVYYPYILGTTKVHLNGVLLKRSIDYEELDGTKISLNESPNETDILTISYLRH